ncbi:hypothetical protein MRX96_038084 [Rhipicephalus microplus]
MAGISDDFGGSLKCHRVALLQLIGALTGERINELQRPARCSPHDGLAQPCHDSGHTVGCSQRGSDQERPNLDFSASSRHPLKKSRHQRNID